MKRKVKKYAGEDGSYVEDDDIGRAIKVGQKPDVEEMKSGIAAGTPTDRQTARDIQSFKAAEVRFPSKKSKPKSRYSDVVKASEMGSQDFSSKSSPAKTSGDSGLSKGAMAAGLGLAAAAGAGAMGARRSMREGTRKERIEPTMGMRRSPVQSMSADMPVDSDPTRMGYYKKGGKTKKMASGGNVSSASSRGDGIAQRGKTKGRIC